MRGERGRCWLAVPHLKLYLDIHSGPGVGATEPAVTTYRQLAQALHQVDENLHDRLAKLRTGWSGAAATETAQALAPLAAWAAETTTAMAAEADAAQECAEAYADARNHVPPPQFLPSKPVTATAWLPALVDNRIDYEPVEVQVDAAHAEAARAMEVYEERVELALTGLPALLNPPRLDVAILPPGSLLGPGLSISVSAAAHPAPQTHAQTAPPAHPAIPEQAPPPAAPPPAAREDRAPRSSTVDRNKVWAIGADPTPADDHPKQQQNPPRPNLVARPVPEPRLEKSTVDRKQTRAEPEEGGFGLRDGVLGFHPAVTAPRAEAEEEIPAALGQPAP